MYYTFLHLVEQCVGGHRQISAWEILFKKIFCRFDPRSSSVIRNMFPGIRILTYWHSNDATLQIPIINLLHPYHDGIPIPCRAVHMTLSNFPHIELLCDICFAYYIASKEQVRSGVTVGNCGFFIEACLRFPRTE